MKKLASTLPNMLLSLSVICCVAAALLVFVYQGTLPSIEKQKQETLQNAIVAVTPQFDNAPNEEGITVNIDGDDLVLYPAKQGEELVGVAVESISHSGFSGDIKVLVGIDTECNIINYSVLEHAETPGLGSRMEEWFRVKGTKHNVIGRSLQSSLAVSKDAGGDVDAITAATISSRAFLESLNKAHQAYKKACADGLIR